MPKLKESSEQQKNRVLRALILKNMELHDITSDQIALKLCFTKRTLLNKMKRPETFTLGELRKLCLILKFSNEEKAMVL